MAKTTFLGYVPSLKSKHEATIVNGRAMKSKGGSIRYLLEGEYDGRKTLPKTVSKADFESVYGFDAKEAEGVILTGYDKDGKFGMLGYEIGVEDKTGFTPEGMEVGDMTYEMGTKKHSFVESTMNHAETVVGSPSPADVEPPAPSESPFPQEPSNENFSAFGLFGDKDEEEESEEPKTQEFTVVLEEGDKLELTDVPETVTGENGEDKEESEEKDEKEGETWRGLTKEQQKELDQEPSFRHKETGEVRGFHTMMKIGMESNFDEILKMNQEWEAIDADGNVVEFEAVQA